MDLIFFTSADWFDKFHITLVTCWWIHLIYKCLQCVQCSHCKRCISYSNSVRPSVRLSLCPSVTRRYCVKTTARSTVQFAPLDSKMCLVLYKQKIFPRDDPFPLKFWLKVIDLPTPEGCVFWHVLPCSASTVRYRKRSSITLNKNSAMAFQRAIHQGSTPPQPSSKWGSKCLDLSSFGRLRQ